METLFAILNMAVSSICPIALIFVLCNFKCSRKTSVITFILLCSSVTAVNCMVQFTFGRQAELGFFSIIVGIPTIGALLFLTKDRFSVIFFNFYTAINALYLVSILSNSVTIIFNTHLILENIVRIILFCFIVYSIRHYFIEPYHLLTQTSNHSLGMVPVIPFLFFCQSMFMGLHPTFQNITTIAIILLYVVLIFVYVIIYQIFRQFETKYDNEYKSQLLETQIMALHAQSEAIYQHEEKAKILNHDLKHYTQMIAGHLQLNQPDEALVILDELNKSIDKNRPAIYCDNFTVNAILSTYFEQAEKEGIQVNSSISLPSKLNINTIDFSVALANALDNAITSCKKARLSNKEISITICYTRNQLIFKLSNTCSEKVMFSPKKIPISHNGEGHGLGSRSIAAFVEKYNGLLDYEQINNTFYMQILIYVPPPVSLS